jgi:hypothetical protein
MTIAQRNDAPDSGNQHLESKSRGDSEGGAAISPQRVEHHRMHSGAIAMTCWTVCMRLEQGSEMAIANVVINSVSDLSAT